MEKDIQRNPCGRRLVSNALETRRISLVGKDHRENAMAYAASLCSDLATRRWITVNRLSEYW